MPTVAANYICQCMFLMFRLVTGLGCLQQPHCTLAIRIRCHSCMTASSLCHVLLTLWRIFQQILLVGLLACTAGWADIAVPSPGYCGVACLLGPLP